MSYSKSSSAELFGLLSRKAFFEQVWQKDAYLFRQAFPSYECPVEAEELAGLALESSVESRIVLESGDSPWELRQGPFSEKDFNQLPKSHWTLLVQQLDAWVPEINELLAHFDFLPRWQIDDIMASFAPKGGSVGPHFDYYDVFLLQAQGTRKWKIGQHCTRDEPQRLDTPLSILSHFETQREWTLEPGDMLYVPPGLAHWGVSDSDNCITFSVGFRAVQHQQLFGELADEWVDSTESDHFLPLKPNAPDQSIYEINFPEVAQEIKTLVSEKLRDELLVKWFGEYATRPKNPDIFVKDESALAVFDTGSSARLLKNEGSRFAFACASDHVMMFVDGVLFKLDSHLKEFAIEFCNSHELAIPHPLIKDPQVNNLLKHCVQCGSLYVD